jgi:hypothetical protein
MRINEIPQVAGEYDNDFIFAFCTFLDEFYAADGNEKALLLADEPNKGLLDNEQYCTLAAAAHKLANDYNISIPKWTMKKNYVMPYPVYAFNASKPEYQELLQNVTPDEFKMRNLFLGSKILQRV